MTPRSLLLPLAFLVSTPVLAQAPAVEVADFQGVSVGQGLRAEVKRGDKSVRLEGDARDVARVKLEVKDGVLTTRVTEESWASGGLKGVRLYVTTPRLERLTASGGARVEAEANPDTRRVEASGGSHVRLSGLEAKTLEARASGGSELSLQGRAQTLDVAATGGSTLAARELQVGSLEVTASGGSTLEASAEQSLRGTLSGGSTLTSATRPAQVDVKSSGGSRVSYR